MTTQTLITTAATASSGHPTQPTAAELAQAQPVLTRETFLVCGGLTVLLTIVAGFIGLGIALVITGLVLWGNYRVHKMSIKNAMADRLEREGQR